MWAGPSISFEVSCVEKSKPSAVRVSIWLAGLAVACGDSGERPWALPGTSLDAAHHRSDAGTLWHPANPASDGSAQESDAGAGSDAAASQPCDGESDAGCTTVVDSTPRVLGEVYAGQCNGDAIVQWGFLTYEATTPSDSTVRFRLRTATTRSGLSSASWTELITAQASPDTQVCGFIGPVPCPIDLYAVLDGPPRAHHAFAELGLILNPSTDGARVPTVQGWNLSYSCPLGQ